MRKAVVSLEDGFVLNVIEIEEDANWQSPVGCILVDAKTGGSPGDTWDGEKFITPESVHLLDYKAQWKSAVTLEEKLSIVGKKLKLEDE